MSPCTYLVTGAVTGNKDESSMQRIRRTYAAKGIKVLKLHTIRKHITCTQISSSAKAYSLCSYDGDWLTRGCNAAGACGVPFSGTHDGT